jgi:hypothetical protein
VYNADGSLRRIDTDDSGLNQRNPFLGNNTTQNVNVQNVLFANLFTRVDLPFGFKYTLNFSPQVEATATSFSARLPTLTNYRVVQVSALWRTGTGTTWIISLIGTKLWPACFDATFVLNKEKFQSWYTRTSNTQFSPNDDLGYHNIGAGTLPVESSDDRIYNADALNGPYKLHLYGQV